MDTRSAIKWAAFNGASAVIGAAVIIFVIDRLSRDEVTYLAPSFVEEVGVGGSIILAAALFVLVASLSFGRMMLYGSDDGGDGGGGDFGSD